MYYYVEVNYNVTANQKNRKQRIMDAEAEFMKIDSLMQP